MINPAQIPPEVWVAATIRLEALGSAVAGYTARDVIAAALNAWPGMGLEYRSDNPRFYNGNLVILPLPQEASDDQ